jgi:hypothetical protein
VRRAAASAVLAAVLLTACGPSAERREADRREIEALVARYAEKLTQAYRTGDAEPLREVATEREVSRVFGQIQSLAVEGRALRPQLIRQSVETVEIHRATAATATTVETWNLRVVAIGTEALVSESPEQTNRIVYTLNRDQGRWWILSRILRSSSEP